MKYNDLIEALEVTLDGESIDPGAHRHTTGLFELRAEARLMGALPEPCLNGMNRSGVSDGTWLAVTVTDGEHKARVTGVEPGGGGNSITRMS